MATTSLNLIVHGMDGKKIEEIALPEDIFSGKPNHAVMHQAVVMYQANQRQGNASTKERGVVSGGGKKPFRQKGTGRARAGSIRSPLWMGGGVVFGPHPRDFSYTVPKKIKTAALRESIHAKFLSDDLFCVESLTPTSQKTKDFEKILNTLKLRGNRVLALLDKSDSDIARVSRNLQRFCSKRVDDVNAYDILSNKKVLITKAAFKHLLKKINT